MMKMTIHEEVVEAVILKKTPYKENDMILHIYSHEYGDNYGCNMVKRLVYFS